MSRKNSPTLRITASIRQIQTLKSGGYRIALDLDTETDVLQIGTILKCKSDGGLLDISAVIIEAKKGQDAKEKKANNRRASRRKRYPYKR